MVATYSHEFCHDYQQPQRTQRDSLEGQPSLHWNFRVGVGGLHLQTLWHHDSVLKQELKSPREHTVPNPTLSSAVHIDVWGRRVHDTRACK